MRTAQETIELFWETQNSRNYSDVVPLFADDAVLDVVDRGDVDLVAGMPVEAYVTTGDRSPFSYFTKPLTDYFNKALREE